MKKVLISIITPFVLLLASTYFLRQSTHPGMQLSADMQNTLAAEADTLPNDSMPDFGDEFEYYFDRHNVMDEGYEMVAAFANGKRLQIEPAQRLTVWNVGNWRNRTHEGTTLALDSAGFTIVATYQADTIKTGLRIDSLGTYQGDFRGTKANGHGAYIADGSYFEGTFEDGQPDKGQRYDKNNNKI